MNIDHLTLVRGRSFEQITELLSNNGIKFKIKSEPDKTNSHFRESLIRINPEDKTRTDQLLGKPARHSRFAYFYYAEYKIESNFDWTILSGNPCFRKGLLVESAGIEYRKIKESVNDQK